MPNHTTPQEIKLFNNQTKPQEIELWVWDFESSLIVSVYNWLTTCSFLKHQPALVRNWVQASVKSLYGISGCNLHAFHTSWPPKNVFRLKLLLLTCSILFFVFFWGLRGQILGALGSVYIALLVSWTPHMIQRWTWVRAWTRDAVEKWFYE